MADSFQVLVISDNQETQSELKKNLVRLGCKVKLSDSAEAGIIEIKKNRFDAIFAELCVREKGGRFVARWVKNESINSKVFIVTSWRGELDSNLLQLDGINDIVHKPLVFKEIRDKLLEYIG
jgi:DNA-binding response OmpR family regulator